MWLYIPLVHKSNVLEFSLLCEDAQNEVEDLVRVELFFSYDELALLEHFDIKQVSHETLKKVNLGYDDANSLA